MIETCYAKKKCHIAYLIEHYSCYYRQDKHIFAKRHGACPTLTDTFTIQILRRATERVYLFAQRQRMAASDGGWDFRGDNAQPVMKCVISYQKSSPHRFSSFCTREDEERSCFLCHTTPLAMHFCPRSTTSQHTILAPAQRHKLDFPLDQQHLTQSVRHQPRSKLPHPH